MKNFILALLATWPLQAVHAQLSVASGARVNIQGGAYIVATGNVTSTSSFLGTGTLVMRGSTPQQLGMGGTTVPRVQINNSSNVTLSGNTRISQELSFSNGKLLVGGFGLFLENAAVLTGYGPGKFLETNSSGRVRKLLTANVTNLLIPLGNGTNYTPLTLTTSGSYSGAEISMLCRAAVHPNKPSAAAHYLNAYWTVSRTGITGNVSGTATYANANIVGNEALLKSNFWTGTAFTKTGTSMNTASNQITANVTGSGGDIYAMSDPGAALAAQSELEEGAVLNMKISAYPNPTKGLTIVELGSAVGENALLSVRDIHGRIVKEKRILLSKGANRATIDLSGLANGFYELQLISKNKRDILRVIKQ